MKEAEGSAGMQDPSGEDSVEASAAKVDGAAPAMTSATTAATTGGRPQDSADGSEPSLLQSMTEVMALSYLCFMYADVRSLSSTGRISTRFEHIAVESDYSPRYEAGFIAGDEAAGSGRAAFGPRKSSGRKCGGVSTAQIMAVMLLEIEREASKRRKTRRREDLNLSERAGGGKDESVEKKRDQEKMERLLESYSHIIGADFVKEEDREAATVSRSVRDLASSTLQAPVDPNLLLDDENAGAGEQQRQQQLLRRSTVIPKFQDVVRMIKERASMEPNADGGEADDANLDEEADHQATARSDATPQASNTTGEIGGGAIGASRADMMDLMRGQHGRGSIARLGKMIKDELTKEESREFIHS